MVYSNVHFSALCLQTIIYAVVFIPRIVLDCLEGVGANSPGPQSSPRQFQDEPPGSMGLNLMETNTHICCDNVSGNLFIYKARESNLVPEGFLTAQLMQKV